MIPREYRLITAIALAFTIAFVVIVVPALVRDGGDVIHGLGQGFVNPYSTGYSLDVVSTWLILAAWIAVERNRVRSRWAWGCLALGLVPGVAVGLAAYLVVRHRALAISTETRADA